METFLYEDRSAMSIAVLLLAPMLALLSLTRLWPADFIGNVAEIFSILIGRYCFMPDSSDQKRETAGVIVDGRAVFYYPPGSKTGWTLKRIIGVSLLGYMTWSLIFMVIAKTVSLLPL